MVELRWLKSKTPHRYSMVVQEQQGHSWIRLQYRQQALGLRANPDGGWEDVPVVEESPRDHAGIDVQGLRPYNKNGA